MKHLLITLIVCVFGSAAVLSQAPSRLTSTSGFSFEAPKGWRAQDNGGGAFALVNQAETILIEVRGHSYRDLDAFWADANLKRDGLELVGKPQEIKNGITFRTVKRQPKMIVIDAAVLFSPNGGGTQIAALTDEANSNDAFNAALAIADSVRFEAPKADSVGEKVRSVLAGKRLIYLFTGNGYSERKDIVLCSNGVFYQSTDMGGFTPGNVDGPSFAATGGKRGRWSIGASGSVLALAFENAGTVQYTLSARQASNEIGMNGQRWFVQSQTLCR